MKYCINCGNEMDNDAKFCQNCGTAAYKSSNIDEMNRETMYEGKIHKCPNCGEIINSFDIICSSCGWEIRSKKSTNSVKELEIKLEKIEEKRVYEKRGFFNTATLLTSLSKTDEQKISLIKSFAVPNTKEDILEFTILATSNINEKAYDSANTRVSKSEREISDAWLSKVKQVYIKATQSNFDDETINTINKLYETCLTDIKKSKKKGIIKWVLLFWWIPAIIIALIGANIYAPIDEAKELKRLNAIVEEIEIQIDNHEYKYALMNAKSLVYSGTITNDEQKRKWIIKREYWIDQIKEKAKENGVSLDFKINNEDSNNYDEFITGFEKADF